MSELSRDQVEALAKTLFDTAFPGERHRDSYWFEAYGHDWRTNAVRFLASEWLARYVRDAVEREGVEAFRSGWNAAKTEAAAMLDEARAEVARALHQQCAACPHEWTPEVVDAYIAAAKRHTPSGGMTKDHTHGGGFCPACVRHGAKLGASETLRLLTDAAGAPLSASQRVCGESLGLMSCRLSAGHDGSHEDYSTLKPRMDRDWS